MCLLLALTLAGCTLTIDNDDSSWGGNGDRWYTGGMRGRRDVPPEGEAGAAERCWVDGFALDVAESLDLLTTDAPEGARSFTTVGSVLAMEVYTPDDIETEVLVEGDRPYAGWIYAGVVRYDTHLDPDPLRRRDQETEVELDVGVVGPVTQAEALQDKLHELFGGDAPNGWDNQLENEPGVVLSARRSVREAYGEDLARQGLAYDVISSVGGALGNIDTHAAASGGVRVGWNLSRALRVAAGDRRRLAPGAAPRAEGPASLYGYAELEARLVLRNLFLDGNTFRDSHHVDREELVGALRVGVAWEWGAYRLGYAWTRRSEEFEDQPGSQTYGTFLLSWMPAP